MIKSCVTIALVPGLKTGPWIFWENLEASIAKAARLGFDGIELFTPTAAAVNAKALAVGLKDAGLALAAVGTGAGKVLQGLTLTDADPAVRKRAVSFIADMISFGARFGAPAIIGSMQGNAAAGLARETVFEWLAEGLATLADHAQREGVRLLYEPLNRYETNLLTTQAEGAAFLQSLGRRNVGLLADLFHMNIEEQSLPAAIRQVGPAIGHVHFADSNRRPAGMGHTPMQEIADALRDVGYGGYLSAEAFPWPDPDEAAAQTMRAFRQFFPRRG